MNNVHKHAAAKNVSIIVELRRNEVLAIVEDDGVGVDVDVDVDAASAPDSGNRLPPKIGISGMRERAALVGGQLTLESTPGAGTTVRVRIPLRSKSRG
jgi:signal transduction histidine kinase